MMEQGSCKNKACCMHEATESQLAKDVNVNLDDLQSVLKFKSFEDITQEFLSIISTKNEGVIREIKKIQDEVIKIENMKRDFENLMETFANKYHEETQLLYKKLNEATGNDTLQSSDEEDFDNSKTSPVMHKRRYK